MHNRREFVAVASALGALLSFTACSRDEMAGYNTDAAALRQRLAADPDMLQMLRYASLAANSHNSQPWRFAVDDFNVSILPDSNRRLPVVDPDDHNLFVSLGCAVENLLITGAANGRPGNMLYFPGDSDRIEVGLNKGRVDAGILYDAIPVWQTTRSIFDGRAIPVEQLKQLENAAKIDGVSVMLIADDAKRFGIEEQAVDANSAQLQDKAFVAELKTWLRFNPGQAHKTRDGLFTACSGHTSVPTAMGETLFATLIDNEKENRTLTAQILASPVFAVFVGDRADKDHWIRVGRSFQRLTLMATSLGIRHAYVNQPIEVPAARDRFAIWLGIAGQRPDLVIRLGYAEAMPMSLRRPVADALGPREVSP
jgi:nitroreductase